MSTTTQNLYKTKYKICPKCRGIGCKYVMEKTHKPQFITGLFTGTIFLIFFGNFIISFLFGMMIAVMLSGGYEQVITWKCSRCKGVGAIFPRQIIHRADRLEPVIIY